MPLPPTCKDATEAEIGQCTVSCEYKPTDGKLNATQKWHWGTHTASESKEDIDIWSTPTVARITDTNCDGVVDKLDPPNIIFVSGNGKQSQCILAKTCRLGVLRVLDGSSGKEVWSKGTPDTVSPGFAAGISVALGDVDRNGSIDIVAASGDGHIVILDRSGNLLAKSDTPIIGSEHTAFGWGGGLAIGDMNSDGNVEIAYGPQVFTLTKAKSLISKFVGTKGRAGGIDRELSFFADLNGDGQQELVTGKTAYTWPSGEALWHNPDIGNGYSAIADFDRNGTPEIAVVYDGKLSVINGNDGAIIAGPLELPGAIEGKASFGGPPTIADFDGDKRPEVGVSRASYYSAVKVDMAKKTLSVLWKQDNHDLSSSVTGSTVFDFEGDGRAEVIYNDECFLWVYDGKTGAVKFATPTTSFTATESSLVADVDGDGHAEILMIANGIDPAQWKCTAAPWTSPDPTNNRPAWVPPPGAPAYRGLTVWGDKANSWVGTRTLWNQHAYHVSNICDGESSACDGEDNHYGYIPQKQTPNWTTPWLNNFRQNIQEGGLFNAPDLIVSVSARCTVPIELNAIIRNIGEAPAPKGAIVEFYSESTDGGDSSQVLGRAETATVLLPGQMTRISIRPENLHRSDLGKIYYARIADHSQNKHYNECRYENNQSEEVTPKCQLE